jgi:acyl-coenzyme A synthetase/AMP-(fatty) acid ligase
MSRQLHDVIAEALAGDPDQIALEFGRRGIRWNYLTGVAERVDAMLHEAGFDAAVPVAFVPRNRPAFVGALLALLRGRRSVMMVYAFQSPTAIAADLARLQCPAVIADMQDWTTETLAAIGPGVLAIGLASDVEAVPPVTLVAKGNGDRSGLRGPTSEPVIEMLTSGTTGTPKRSPTLYSTVERAVISGSVLDAGGAGKAGDPGTVNFPISNISGIYSLLPMLALRRLVLLQEKFSLDDWLAFVAAHRPAVAVMPPAGVRMMLDRKVPSDALAGVKYIQIGTAALDIEAHRAFERTYGVAILLSYGATEFCGAATTMTADLHAQAGAEKFGSVGKPVGGNQVRIVDPVTRVALPAGEVGIIEVKVPMLGDAFIHTTDLGVIDADGFLFHRGRVDGVIVRGGFKIMPGPVERVLNAYPGVVASCVVGVSEARLGQVPVAVIELQQDASAPDPADLSERLRAELPATNIPVTYHFVATLPRTPSLKIDLSAVRALAEARYGQTPKDAAT